MLIPLGAGQSRVVRLQSRDDDATVGVKREPRCWLGDVCAAAFYAFCGFFFFCLCFMFSFSVVMGRGTDERNVLVNVTNDRSFCKRQTRCLGVTAAVLHTVTASFG